MFGLERWYFGFWGLQCHQSWRRFWAGGPVALIFPKLHQRLQLLHWLSLTPSQIWTWTCWQRPTRASQITTGLSIELSWGTENEGGRVSRNQQLSCWNQLVTDLWTQHEAQRPVSDVEHEREGMVQRPGRREAPGHHQPGGGTLNLPHQLWRVRIHRQHHEKVYFLVVTIQVITCQACYLLTRNTTHTNKKTLTWSEIKSYSFRVYLIFLCRFLTFNKFKSSIFSKLTFFEKDD